MIDPKNISIQDYTYELPDKNIALYPLSSRDDARLLFLNNGVIEDHYFKTLDQFLPEKSLLVFNDTRVIKARMRFQKSTGGTIEIFCLEPFEAINEYTTIMNQKSSVRWKCMIGGLAKWKEGELKRMITIGHLQLTIGAKLIEKLHDAYVVEFFWQPADLSFAEVMDAAGDIPLPPYIKRATELTDTERYQTIYAKDEGSVAAPTAGLHFTDAIFNKLAAKNISKGFITLHVGAGTFKPVKAATMLEHEMHAEWMEVNTEMIELILLHLNDTITAVGTTSLRTLESLYWLGLKAMLQPQLHQLSLLQWEVYSPPLQNATISAEKALMALLQWMNEKKLKKLFTQTQILIAPGYSFKIAKALITNFHQPQSTLLLLVAAAIGEQWKDIYAHALQNNYRFLSYGDGCLLYIR